MMRKHSIILLFILGSLNLHGQNISAFNNKLNFVFLGIDNPIGISGVRNCNDVIIKASNGDITQVGECEYKFNPKKPGKVYIKVYRIVSKDTVEIASKEFKVRDFPGVYACIRHKYNCSVDKSFLVSSTALTAPVINWDIDLYYPVQSFDIIIIRNDKVIFIKPFFQSKFSMELIKEFEKLEKGDLIFFYNILVKNVIDNNRKLSPINFVVE